VSWRFIRLREEEYEELKRMKEERGMSSFSDVIAELLRCKHGCKQTGEARVEGVETNGVEKPGQQKLVILSDYALDWLDGIRRHLTKALNNEFRFDTVDLTLSDVLDIIGYAMAVDKDTKYQVNGLIIKAIINAIRKTARSGMLNVQ
jgi:predicted CopG family antitoxin